MAEVEACPTRRHRAQAKPSRPSARAQGRSSSRALHHDPWRLPRSPVGEPTRVKEMANLSNCRKKTGLCVDANRVSQPPAPSALVPGKGDSLLPNFYKLAMLARSLLGKLLKGFSPAGINFSIRPMIEECKACKGGSKVISRIQEFAVSGSNVVESCSPGLAASSSSGLMSGMGTHCRRSPHANLAVCNGIVLGDILGLSRLIPINFSQPRADILLRKPLLLT